MQHLHRSHELEMDWFSEEIVTAKAEDVVKSKLLHCGVAMDEYVGDEFVDWTHRCVKCGVLHGCS